MRRASPRSLALAIAATSVALAPTASCDDPPPSVEVRAQPFVPRLVLEGKAALDEAFELRLDLEGEGAEDAPLDVVEARGPGAVSRGDVVLRLRSERLEDEAARLRADAAAAASAAELRAEEVARAEEAAAVALRAAGVARDQAVVAHESGRDVEIPLRRREAELDLAWERDWLDDSVRDLKEFERIYGEDGVLEESERIVLERSRRWLARQRESVEHAETRFDLVTRVELPRDLEGLAIARREAEQALAEATRVGRARVLEAAAELSRARVEAASLARESERAARNLAALTLSAPASGDLLLGAEEAGAWSPSEALVRAARARGRVKAAEVVLTVVPPGAARVRARLPETQALEVAEGAPATVEALGAGAPPWTGRLARIGRVPFEGAHDVFLEVAAGASPPRPGIPVRVRLEGRRRERALLVPSSAVRARGEERTVRVVKDGAVSERRVRTGVESDGRVEVLEGLAEGERVVVVAAR
jgi:hypothetical protein